MITVVDGIEWDLVPRPAKVQCDVCKHHFKAGRKFMSADERAELACALLDAGWIVVGDHEQHICPDCNRKDDA